MEEKKTIRVVYVEPFRYARVIELGTELEDMQKAVGGDIELFYPFDEEVAIVCNEEGKYNGMCPNRVVYGKDGKMLDIIFGSFFICDCSGDDYGSLSDKQIERYQKMFQYPENIIEGDNKTVVLSHKRLTKADREER